MTASLAEPVEASGADAAWLVVIDPQNIFAAPDSAWGSPFFGAVMPQIQELAAAFGERVLVTRWLPTADRSTSWGEYFAAWPFADQPDTDPLFDLVPTAAALSTHPTVDAPTFGKWAALEEIVGAGGRVVLTGVSTDCCVISTALAAADAGARVTVVTDACAGSDAANHTAAVHVMGLYPPQITLSTTAELLAGLA